MRLGLLLRRQNQLPHVEGVIRAAAARGHTVILLADESRRGPKGFPEEAHVPRRLRGMVRWMVVGSWEAPYRARILRDLNVLLVPAAIDAPPELFLEATPLVALQTNWSDLMRLDPHPWQLICGFGPIWAQWYATLATARDQAGARDAAVLRDLFVPVGVPLLDHLNWLDPDEARRGLGLPRDVLVYSPFPYGSVPWSPWSHAAWGWPWPLGVLAAPFCPAGSFRAAWRGDHDRALVRAVRRLADRHGLPLVVKARRKTDLPGYLRRAADHVLHGDGDPGEPPMLRLLACARALIHWYSTSAIEASLMGVPSICLAPTAQQWPAYAERTAPDAFGVEQDWMRLYGYPGVSWRMRPEEACWLADTWPNPPAASEAALRYGREFATGPIGLAGEAVVEAIETRVLGLRRGVEAA